MNHADQTADNKPAAEKNSISSRWLNFRRKRFWVLCAILLYTIVGFFVVPVIVEKNIISLLQDDLGRTARIENIAFNPYVLSLRIEGFELEDKDKVKLAAFNEFYINFQLSSLINRAFTFNEIHLIEPYFLIERFSQTESRLGQLVNDFNESRPTEDNTSQQEEVNNEMPRLLIHDLVLAKGHVDLKDNLPDTTVETQLSPINISVQGLNTLPDRHGKQSVNIQLADNATLKWNGSLTLGPLDSEGELVLEGLRLDPAIAYLKSSMPLESIAATFSTALKYRVHMDLGSQPEINVSDWQIELAGVEVHGLTPTTKIVEIPSLILSGGQFSYPEQRLQFAGLVIDKPQLVTWLKEDASLNLLDLVPTEEAVAEPSPGTSNETPWLFGIDSIELKNGAVDFADNSIEPVANLNVQELQISLSGLNNQANTTIPVKLNGRLQQGGEFNLDGELNLIPDLTLVTQIVTRDLPLNLGQPYAQQFARIQINDGNLNSDIKLNVTDSQNLTASGSLQIPSLEIINTLDNGKLLSWNSLDIDKLDFNLDSRQLHFSQLTFDQLFGALLVDENKVTNVAALIIEQQEESSDSDSKPIDLVIGGILVKDSSMDFSDLSLPLPFSTHIINLGGRISTIDLNSDTPANIKLEGQVDEYGLARIDGTMNVLDPIHHTDVTLEFRNLLMSNLSPYSAQFAGQEIDKGKMDLDLGYSIEKGLLNGSNNVVLSELELGKKVEHPDAASLPLGLAVSLLKDSDGVIKVDLPVEGDINNPEFRIGGVIWTAFSGMITKLISAPFRLLGNLIGIDSEDLGQFEFLAGRFDLTPPELEKVAQIEEALQQRPELGIEVSGVVDRNIDTIALKKIKLIKTATERLGEEFDSQDETGMMLDDRIRKLVEEIFSERLPDVDRTDIKAQHTAPSISDPEGPVVLDELAYATALWNRLVDAEPVSDQDLTELAQARAQVIRDAFLSDGQFDENRIVIAAPKEVESADQQWVVLELAVAAK